MKSTHTHLFPCAVILAALFFCTPAKAQSIYHQWAFGLSGASGLVSNSVGVDGAGNVYIAGFFSGAVDFNPGAATNTLTSAGGTDIFIAKYTAAGSYIWAKGIGGPTGNDQALKVKVDRNGNLYFSGYYTGTVDFDAGAPVYNLTNAGAEDGFFAKYDSSGTFKWARQIGGSGGNDRVLSIEVDKNNRVYVCGNYFPGCDADPGASTVTLTNFGSGDFFFGQYDTLGNYVWAKGIGANLFTEQATDLAVDDSGYVHVVGQYSSYYGSPDFDPGAGSFTMSGGAGYLNTADVFVAKYTNAGNFVWARSTISTYYTGGHQMANGVNLDSLGAVYISGGFYNSPDFDPGASVYTLTSSGGSDIYLWKLDKSGSFVFANRIGNSSDDYISDQHVDYRTGDITVSGTFHGTNVDFDPGASTTANLNGNNDIFVARYDLYGNYKWAFGINNTLGTDRAYGIVCDSLGSAFPTGYFYGSSSTGVDFDPGAGTNLLYAVSGANPSCAFFAKYAGCVSAPAQPGAITGDSMVCSGVNKPYASSPVSGATGYVWTFPATWSAVTASFLAIATTGTVSDTIRFKAVNACGTSPEQKKYVKVLQTPAQPGAITGDTVPCSGSSSIYRIAAVTNATSYQWQLPSGWSGTSTADSINVVAGSSGDSILVRAVNNCGNSPWRKLNIAVNSIPATPVSVTGSTFTCGNKPQTYSTAAVSKATFYNWQVPATWGSAASSTTSINVVTGTASDTISVRAGNACGTSAYRRLVVSIKSLPAKPSAISGNSTVCVGTSQTYSVTPVSGVSYSWTLPPGWTGSSATNSINVTAGNTGDTIKVTASDSCGTSQVQWLPVQVKTVPSMPVFATSVLQGCAGTTQVFKIFPVNGATIYDWLVPSGWSGGSTDTIISVNLGNNNDTISVLASNSCGSSAFLKGYVQVNKIPVQPASISGAATPCSGTSQVYNIAAVNGATSYNWTLPSGWTGSSTGSTINATTTAQAGTVLVTAANTCGSSAAQSLSVTPVSAPAQPGSITGNTLVCAGSLQNYSVSAVNGATFYTWAVPSGWNGASTNSSLSVLAGTGSGTISVVAGNTCGNSSAQSIGITVNQTPQQPSAITGPSPVCEGSQNIYSIASVSGATGYQWTLPGGAWSGTSATTSISVTTGSSAGTLAVSAVNNCGNSTVQTLAVNVNKKPSVSLNLTDTVFCSTISQVSLSGGFPAGGTYSGTGVSGTLFSPVAAGIGLHNITYDYTDANSCSNSTMDVVNVKLCTTTGAAYTAANGWSSYPNPANNKLLIEHPGADSNWSVHVFSILGNEVGLFVSDQQLFELNTAEWKAGVYLLMLKDGHAQTTHKLVVQH